jgi:hypothetical protein
MAMDDMLGALLDDPDFWTIQRSRSNFNLFEAVGGETGELKHSNFLAYLLSPSRPHGFGTRPLEAFLRKILANVPADQRPITNLELILGDLDDAIVHRESENIDLLIEIDSLNFVLLVENKIGAKAGKGQLERYRDLVARRYPDHRQLLVFLTPAGAKPDDDGYVAFSYVELASALEPLADIADVSVSETSFIVRHYIDMLRKRIVGDEEMQALAAKLYERHKEAFQFIYQHAPRSGSLVEAVAGDVQAVNGLVIETEGAASMRFVPASWDDDLAYRSEGWTASGRGFLFELKNNSGKPGRVLLSLVMGPGEAAYREAIYAAAQAEPDVFQGLQKPMGKLYSTVWSKVLLTPEQAAPLTAEQQRNNVLLAFSNFRGVALPALIEAVTRLDEAHREKLVGLA